MVFSKSFGYAVRGLLYIAAQQREKPFVQADELADALRVPKHFMSKILKRLAANGVLHSVKGPYGGFELKDDTLKTRLIDLLKVMDGVDFFHTCVLQIGECHADNPCPLHYHVLGIRDKLERVLTDTPIGSLVGADYEALVKSIRTHKEWKEELN